MEGPGFISRYEYGYSHAEVGKALLACMSQFGASLIQRKGLLIVPCADPAALALVQDVMTRYYASPVFDVVPALVSAFREASWGHPDLLTQLPIALVVRDLDLTAVGGVRGAVRLFRGGEQREIFSPVGPGASLRATPVGETFGEAKQTLYAVSWRLFVGDAVIAGEREVLERAGGGTLWRAVRRHPSAGAALVARSGRQGRRDHPPVAVLLASRLRPVPDMPPSLKGQPKVREPRMPVRREGISPIWIALCIAAVALMASYALRRPDLSRESVIHWFKIMFIPASIAPPTAQGTPTPSYPFKAPTLASPRNGETILGAELTLRWNWEGRLAEGAFFEVHISRAGAPEEITFLTKAKEQTVRLTEAGWYDWTVLVVRLRGDKPEQASPRPVGWQFFWPGNP
ncbi:MAG: hypothetical protein H5T66_03810 [Chloroflexi bacterium]|nr:hypothetical protein [Chloroflexota bacterium]